jgi:hypothetical protein
MAPVFFAASPSSIFGATSLFPGSLAGKFWLPSIAPDIFHQEM